MSMKQNEPAASRITHRELLEKLHYDPATGVFTHRDGPRLGLRAGWVGNDGYRALNIDGIFYRSHQVAWFYVHKRWPKLFVDHINRVRDDNRIANLRLANKSQQAVNSVLPKTNTSGYRGVSRRNSPGTPWMAQIRVNGKKRYLGLFQTAELAHAAYAKVCKEVHGEFVGQMVRTPHE